MKETDKNQNEFTYDKIKKKYYPIPFGFAKLLLGVLALVGYIYFLRLLLNVCQAEPSPVNVMNLVFFTIFPGGGYLIYLLMKWWIFGPDKFRRPWPLNWLGQYGDRNLAGYRYAATKCFHCDQIFHTITVRNGKRCVAGADSPEKTRECELSCHKNYAPITISVALGGWFTRRVFVCSQGYDWNFRLGGFNPWCRLRLVGDFKFPRPSFCILDNEGNKVTAGFNKVFDILKLLRSYISSSLQVVLETKLRDDDYNKKLISDLVKQRDEAQCKQRDNHHDFSEL